MRTLKKINLIATVFTALLTLTSLIHIKNCYDLYGWIWTETVIVGSHTTTYTHSIPEYLFTLIAIFSLTLLNLANFSEAK